MPRRVLQLRVMPAPDLGQDEVDRAWGEAAIRRPLGDPRRTEEECRRLQSDIAGAFPFEIIGEREARVIG
jgi:hypothetical protein